LASSWNYPVGEIPLLMLPALVAGNAVILKPSEVTPVTGAMYCEALASALPPGVLQLVQGDGGVGSQLVASPDVHMVAMTGSTNTGKRIMESCAANLKRLVLELGGKDPMVVFADADLDQAAADAVGNSLYNQGQSCCSVERVYVAESVKAEFEQKVVALAKEQKVGVPTEEGVTVVRLADDGPPRFGSVRGGQVWDSWKRIWNPTSVGVFPAGHLEQIRGQRR